MMNIGFLTIALVLVAILILLSISLFKNKELYPSASYLLLVNVFMICWIVSYTLFLYEPESSIFFIYYMFVYVFKGLIAVCLLLVVLKFAYPLLDLRFKNVYIFFAVSFITIVLALTNKYHGLLYTKLDVLMILPDKIISYERGIWSYVQHIYSFICIISALAIIVFNFKFVPVTYKAQYFMFMVGLVCALATNFLEFFEVISGFDSSLIGNCLAACILYWAIINYSSADLTIFAKDAVFQKISCMAFVLGNDDKIIDSNPNAKNTLGFLGKNLLDFSFRELLKIWIKEKNGELKENESGYILTVDDDKAKKRCHYQITRSEIKSGKNRKLGEFVEIRDVTTQQESLMELYRLVNYDQLTNLYNRRYFELMCEKYDSDEYLPLCFISGDLNKLKVANDSYGHAVGDRLIVLMGELLKKVAPEEAVVSRHGGDEFFILIPSFTKEQAEKYIEDVNTVCANHYEEPFGSPTISLGYSIKTDMHQSIRELLLAADLLMYENKKGSSHREESRVPYTI